MRFAMPYARVNPFAGILLQLLAILAGENRIGRAYLVTNRTAIVESSLSPRTSAVLNMHRPNEGKRTRSWQC